MSFHQSIANIILRLKTTGKNKACIGPIIGKSVQPLYATQADSHYAKYQQKGRQSHFYPAMHRRQAHGAMPCASDEMGRGWQGVSIVQGSPTWGGAKGARSDKEEGKSEQRGEDGQQGAKLKEQVNDVAEHSGKKERGKE